MAKMTKAEFIARAVADRMKDRLRGQFQSTLPTRGSDVRDACHPLAGVDISIHAPHEGERRV